MITQVRREGSIDQCKMKVIEKHVEEGCHRYKMLSRKRIGNVVIKCEYREQKDNKYSHTGRPYYSTIDIGQNVVIELYTRDKEMYACYQLFASNICPQANDIDYVDENKNMHKLTPDHRYFDKLLKVVKFINEKGDKFTVSFLNATMEMIEGEKDVRVTPIYVINAFEHLPVTDTKDIALKK